MTRKKRNHPDIEEILARPWCYYCERDFDDLKILISHQKAKHFKCEQCGRRLNTAGGLSVHMNQVHKETLETVENALPNRSDLSVEIFGMEGIPEDVIQQHNQRVAAQFHQDEAERRAASGNPAPGSAGGPSGPKKPKTESVSDLKKRLAEFKAKKAAGELPASNSGDATPNSAGVENQQSPRSPAPPFQSGSPQIQQTLQTYPTHPTAPQASFPPQYGQQAGYGMPQAAYGQTQPGFPPSTHSQPPGMPPFMQFPQPGGNLQLPSQQYGAPFPFQQQNTPQPQNSSLAPPPPGMPTPPGLPQRPAFGMPPVNAYQMQQMHAGHASSFNNQSQDPRIRPSDHQRANQDTSAQPSVTASSVDDLIASVARESKAQASSKDASNTSGAAEKKSKKEKDKDKATKLIYSDNEISPEERMAKLPRYAFDPTKEKGEVAMGDAVHATVTGTVQD